MSAQHKVFQLSLQLEHARDRRPESQSRRDLRMDENTPRYRVARDLERQEAQITSLNGCLENRLS